MRLHPLALAINAAVFSFSQVAHAQQPAPVSETALRAHLAFLADDLLEGRGTGQRGGDLTVRYLETQAALIGLKPIPGGGYRQKVEIEGSKLASGSATFTAGGKTFKPELGKSIVMGTRSGKENVSFDAPLVFVGYGAAAPEENWDDYKGLDA